MPLRRGTSPAVKSSNIKEMVDAGHPQDQSVAAAMREADDSARGNAMPATMKSHAPGGAKRRPAKFGKM